MSEAPPVRLLTRAGEPEPEIDEELGAIEVERRVGGAFRTALVGLLFADRRRAPGRELVEAMTSEAARLGADGVVDAQLDSREVRGSLVVTLRGRAVRLRAPRQG